MTGLSPSCAGRSLRHPLCHSLRKQWVLWLMLLPTLFFFALFCYLPMVGSYFAFSRFNFQGGLFGSPFVGLDNFQYLFKSGILWSLTRNTILYNIAFIIVGNVMQMICALFFNDLTKKWFTKASQTIIFLPYFVSMVLVGVFIAVVVEVLGIPVLPFAIGLYLPIYLSAPMMLGGLLRWFLERRSYGSDKDKNRVIQSGVLYSSGLIAGEGIVGILLAVLAIIPIGLSAEGAELYVSNAIDLSSKFSIGSIGGLICFAFILLLIYRAAVKENRGSGK